MTPWLEEIWQLAKEAGPFATAMMVFLWYQERQERIKCQGDTVKLVETMEAFNTVGTGLTAAMENRTRATELLATTLAGHTIRLEEVQKAVENIERRV